MQSHGRSAKSPASSPEGRLTRVIEAPAVKITRVVAGGGGGNGRPPRQPGYMAHLRCTIVVSGELGDQFDGVIDGLSLVRKSGTTELHGDLADQSAFQGALRQVADLGLDILSASARPERDPKA